MAAKSANKPTIILGVALAFLLAGVIYPATASAALWDVADRVKRLREGLEQTLAETADLVAEALDAVIEGEDFETVSRLADEAIDGFIPRLGKNIMGAPGLPKLPKSVEEGLYDYAKGRLKDTFINRGKKLFKDGAKSFLSADAKRRQEPIYNSYESDDEEKAWWSKAEATAKDESLLVEQQEALAIRDHQRKMADLHDRAQAQREAAAKSERSAEQRRRSTAARMERQADADDKQRVVEQRRRQRQEDRFWEQRKAAERNEAKRAATSASVRVVQGKEAERSNNDWSGCAALYEKIEKMPLPTGYSSDNLENFKADMKRFSEESYRAGCSTAQDNALLQRIIDGNVTEDDIAYMKTVAERAGVDFGSPIGQDQKTVELSDNSESRYCDKSIHFSCGVFRYNDDPNPEADAYERDCMVDTMRRHIEEKARAGCITSEEAAQAERFFDRVQSLDMAQIVEEMEKFEAGLGQ